MKQLCLLFLFSLSLLQPGSSYAQSEIDLAGKWAFQIDATDVGITQGWFRRTLHDSIHLPGSMAGNGKGDPVTATTSWIGNFSGSAYYTDSFYRRYRQPGNIKIPFCLQPLTYYAGPAWYQKTVVIPAGWKGRHISLFLERCHWQTTLWVEDSLAGSQNSLGTPQEFSLDGLSPGKHRLTLRIDNRITDVDPGVDAHSVSDNTQTAWNGIVGTLRLESRPADYIADVQVFPDVQGRKVHVRTLIRNVSGHPAAKQLKIAVSGEGTLSTSKLVTVSGDSAVIETDLPMGEHPRLWDEFHPDLYTLILSFGQDTRKVGFGMRSFRANGQVFEVNGRRIFLRGTLECAIFPLTGYPPTDLAAWTRIFRIAKSYGLNHLRFHSWCPPEAAFAAADRVGFYLSVECSAWATVGDGRPIDRWLYAESNRMARAFGNHPSFCMMPYGNEPSGKHLTEYLRDFVRYWKQKDPRRVYTTASGWPSIADNDYNVVPEPRLQLWGDGLKGLINRQAPRTDYDWDSLLPSRLIPTVSHEIGQWCVYPSFRERKKYTGVLRAKNFDIFYDLLKEHGMAEMADSFLLASGKLQALCYKAEIEAALRTPYFAGFQLLDLHDFPGQGTALVGVLDPFWDNKGYITAKQYRRFCGQTVPLVRLPQLIYENDQVLDGKVEVAHFGAGPLLNVTPRWDIRDRDGKLVAGGKLPTTSIPIGNGYSLGDIRQPLAGIRKPCELTLTVTVDTFSNSWHFFVYPARHPAPSHQPYVTQRLDQAALDSLHKGGSVLLTILKGSLKPAMGGKTEVGFSSIFWNTAWTDGQAPWTLGILCSPAHPALRDFPTEYYSDYQWWDALSHGSAIRLDSVDGRIRPIVRVIDDWNTAWPLGLLFECRVGKGRLMVSGADLLTDADRRPEARQLLYSLQRYMSGTSFHPPVEVSEERLLNIFR